MHTILLAATTDEAVEFARAASLKKADVLIPRSGKAVRDWTPQPEDVILQFHSFKDHPACDDIEGELLVALSHMKGERPKWARAGQ